MLALLAVGLIVGHSLVETLQELVCRGVLGFFDNVCHGVARNFCCSLGVCQSGRNAYRDDDDETQKFMHASCKVFKVVKGRMSFLHVEL